MFEATVDEFESIMSKQRGAQDETVVRLRGLPWDATESDIAEFFNGTCVCVHHHRRVFILCIYEWNVNLIENRFTNQKHCRQ